MSGDGNDLRKKVSEIGASLNEGSAVGERARQMAESVSDGMRVAADHVMAAGDTASSLASDFEGTIRKNPILAVVAALGLGSLIGIRRR